PADLQYEPADRLRVEHRVEGHDVFNVGRRDLEQAGDISHGTRGDVPQLVLNEVQGWQNSGPFTIGRVSPDGFIEAGTPICRIGERLAFVPQVARRLVERRVVDGWMKRHRSTSPITTSIDPITATTSAMRPPTIIRSSAWQARSEGARALTRQGRFVPSETI